MKRTLAIVFLLALTSAGRAQTSETDEAQVRSLIPAFTAAWGRADAQGLAGLFAPDGDLMIPTGNVFSGRAAIDAFYSSVFAEGYRGSKGTGAIARLRFLHPDVVVGDGTWSIIGAHDKQGREAAPERGVFTVVAVKHGGRWRISALREQTSATALKATN
jgi:uncharacterized protein (TIGR02246 family)